MLIHSEKRGKLCNKIFSQNNKIHIVYYIYVCMLTFCLLGGGLFWVCFSKSTFLKP